MRMLLPLLTVVIASACIKDFAGGISCTGTLLPGNPTIDVVADNPGTLVVRSERQQTHSQATSVQVGGSGCEATPAGSFEVAMNAMTSNRMRVSGPRPVTVRVLYNHQEAARAEFDPRHDTKVVLSWH